MLEEPRIITLNYTKEFSLIYNTSDGPSSSTRQVSPYLPIWIYKEYYRVKYLYVYNFIPIEVYNVLKYNYYK